VDKIVLSYEDQLTFAQLSGDYNPLHVDQKAARRLLTGRIVVHGIHLVLRALNAWCKEHAQPVHVHSIEGLFKHSVGVDQAVSLSILEHDHTGECRIFDSRNTMLLLKFNWDNTIDEEQITIDKFPQKGECWDNSFRDSLTCTGTADLCVEKNQYAKMFPECAQNCNDSLVAILLASTRIVGMNCPGLHSLYSGFNFTINYIDSSTAQSVLNYSVNSSDERFSKLTLAVDNDFCEGTIDAFYRPKPYSQLSFEEVRKLLPTGNFQGERALIIGGSRGVGEVISKILAVGGADVRLTYNQGFEEAAVLKADAQRNSISLEYFHCDILDESNEFDDGNDYLADDWLPTHLYYCATPKIEPSPKSTFDYNKMVFLGKFYLDGLERVMRKLMKNNVQDTINIFYPSSVFVDELPNQFSEYSIIKKAGETYGAYIQKFYPNIRFFAPHLPPLATDQTMSIFKVILSDPFEVLQKELRAFHKVTK